jgi:hypothetical protein
MEIVITEDRAKAIGPEDWIPALRMLVMLKTTSSGLALRHEDLVQVRDEVAQWCADNGIPKPALDMASPTPVPFSLILRFERPFDDDEKFLMFKMKWL